MLWYCIFSLRNAISTVCNKLKQYVIPGVFDEEKFLCDVMPWPNTSLSKMHRNTADYPRKVKTHPDVQSQTNYQTQWLSNSFTPQFASTILWCRVIKGKKWCQCTLTNDAMLCTGPNIIMHQTRLTHSSWEGYACSCWGTPKLIRY